MIKSERKEALIKILVLIASGIILKIWSIFVILIAIINWFITIISGKRNRELANLCEKWNTQAYRYIRYIASVTNERPFPFTHLGPNISKFTK
jgi:hypothetical protein